MCASVHPRDVKRPGKKILSGELKINILLIWSTMLTTFIPKFHFTLPKSVTVTIIIKLQNVVIALDRNDINYLLVHTRTEWPVNYPPINLIIAELSSKLPGVILYKWLGPKWSWGDRAVARNASSSYSRNTLLPVVRIYRRTIHTWDDRGDNLVVRR